jgi:hypothetical protein
MLSLGYAMLDCLKRDPAALAVGATLFTNVLIEILQDLLGSAQGIEPGRFRRPAELTSPSG